MFTKFASGQFRQQKNITSYVISLAVLLLFATNAKADNCDIAKLKFGSSQETIKSLYKIESPEVATEGEATIVSGAPEICKDFPETAVIEFSLIDNKFVQLRIVNENTNNALYKYAVKIFGESDNASNITEKEKQNNKVKLALWNKDNEYSIIYKNYPTGNRSVEKLIMSSNKHKELFDSANLIKTKAMDDYLKENKLGSYSLNSNTTSSDNTKRTQEMNQEMNSLSKNKEIKENENERGYHYDKK